VKRPLSLVTTVAAGAVAMLALPGPAGAVAPDGEDNLVVFNADVHVQGESGLLENPDDRTPADAPLFNVAGTQLPATWGEWSSATATSRAKTAADGQSTDFRVRMENLIPNGVYSLFYVTFGPDTRNPFCVSAERGLPLVARNSGRQVPDASSFVAGPGGAADFRGEAEGDVLAADFLRVVLIYHFDGQTYHPLANYGEFATQGENCRSSYGADAMRQLIVNQREP
jgi:hypothetical protein